MAFCNVRSQPESSGVYTLAAREYLRSLAPTRMPLTTSCRNGLLILKHIQTLLKADIGTRG